MLRIIFGPCPHWSKPRKERKGFARRTMRSRAGREEIHSLDKFFDLVLERAHHDLCSIRLAPDQ